MLVPTVEFITKLVDAHLGPNVDVAAASARKLGDPGNPAGVVISVVNVQEERALANGPTVERHNLKPRYIEPPLFLNLHLLFALDFAAYEASLSHLSKIVELFQARRWFGPQHSTAANPFPPKLEKLTFEMVNLGFEELNNLWGVLGGTYLPSVLYKVRLLRVQAADAVDAPQITTIGLQVVRP
jgi:hypothetical protein